MVHTRPQWFRAIAICFVGALLVAALAVASSAFESSDVAIEAYNDNQTTATTTETTTTSTTATSTTNATATTTTSSANNPNFVRVSGFSRLYEVRNADGSAQTPPRFVWGYLAMMDQYAFEAVRHNNRFFIQMMNTGVYIPINGRSPVDGFDFSGAIWAGPDGILGTADDVQLTLEGTRFYEVVGDAWRFVTELIPNWPPTRNEGKDDATTVTTAASGTTNSAASGSSSPPPPNIPQTGIDLNTSAIVAVVILAMGAGYCGVQFIKNKNEN